MRREGGIGIAFILALLLAAAASHSVAAPQARPPSAPLSPPAAAVEPWQQIEQGFGAPSSGGGDHRIGVEDLYGSFAGVPPAPPAQPVNEPQISGQELPAGFTATANPVLRPADSGWVARRLAVPGLGIDVAVFAPNPANELFPPYAGAYIHSISSQPGRGTNSYIFAHAVQGLFLPLWWAQVGQEVLVQMSDGQVLGYVITAVVRDVPCPDPTKPKPPNLSPALANATECDTSWMMPTPSERLTLQTSQGLNRNYGELVIVAEPAW
jgi:hypothetical protein